MKLLRRLSTIISLSLCSSLLTPFGDSFAMKQKDNQPPHPQDSQHCCPPPQQENLEDYLQENTLLLMFRPHDHGCCHDPASDKSGDDSQQKWGVEKICKEVDKLKKKMWKLEQLVQNGSCGIEAISAVKVDINEMKASIEKFKEKIDVLDKLFKQQALEIGESIERNRLIIEELKKEVYVSVSRTIKDALKHLGELWNQLVANSKEEIGKAMKEMSTLVNKLCAMLGVDASNPDSIDTGKSLIARLQQSVEHLESTCNLLKADIGNPSDLRHHEAFGSFTSMTQSLSLADMLSYLATEFCKFRGELAAAIEDASAQQNQGILDTLTQQQKLLDSLSSTVETLQQLFGGVGTDDVAFLKDWETKLTEKVQEWMNSSDFSQRLTTICQTLVQVIVQQELRSDSSLGTSINELDSLVKSLQKELSSLSGSLEERINAVGGKNEELEGTLSQLSSKVEGMDSSLTETSALARNTQSDLEEKFNEVSRKIQELVENIGSGDSYEDENSVLAKIRALKNEVESLKSLFGEFTGDGTSSTMADALTKLEEQVEAISKSVEENKQTSTETTGQLSQQLTALQGEVSSLKESLGSVDEGSLLSLSQKVTSLETTHTNDVADINSKITSLMALQTQVQEQQETINSQTTLITNLTQKVTNLESELQDVSSTNSDLGTTIQTLTSMLESQQLTITTLNNTVASNTSRIESLESTIVSLTSSMATLQRNYDELYNNIYGGGDSGSPSTSK